jgi:hypothetical protein
MSPNLRKPPGTSANRQTPARRETDDPRRAVPAAPGPAATRVLALTMPLAVAVAVRVWRLAAVLQLAAFGPPAAGFAVPAASPAAAAA